MRSVLLVALLLSGSLTAQALDFAGLRVFTGSGTNGAPTPLVCGTPFSCTPTSFTAAPGDQVSAVVQATRNGFFAIAVNFDTAGLACVNLGANRVVNDMILDPFTLVTWAVGVATRPDSGRCNGGSEVVVIGTIPTGLPSGVVVFQALATSPLSAGGQGLAFSNAVVMNY